MPQLQFPFFPEGSANITTVLAFAKQDGRITYFTAGFYAPKKTRGPAVLTAEVLQQAQHLFDEGLPIAEVAEQPGLLRDTLAKAVRSGRLHTPLKKDR